MAAVLVFAVGGAGGFFWQRYPLKTRFENIATVKSGTPVRVAGIEVGVVTEVRFAGAGAEVWFEVANDVQPLITDQSVAVIGAISLLGEGAIDITPGPEGRPLAAWAYVPSGVAPGSIAALSEQVGAGLNETSRLLADLRAGKGDAVQQGRGSVGRLMNDPKVYNELLAATTALNGITARIAQGEGSLGALLNDPALARSATAAAANLENVTDRLARGEGTAGKLLTDDALFARLTSATTRLDELTSRLEAGQGTAGKLLQDPQLYENMSAAVSEMRGLVSDIRKDPKKYLNVKVSLF
jgi:phospholipid/cholesterol/gamma-HCH transport system substrate-binding protein